MALISVVKQTQANIHVGDFGSNFVVEVLNQNNVPINLATATSITLRLQSPEKEVTDYGAGLLTDGTDGKLVYELEEGDIDVAGEWFYQAIIVYTVGTWHTNIVPFTVYDNIPEPSI